MVSLYLFFFKINTFVLSSNANDIQTCLSFQILFGGIVYFLLCTVYVKFYLLWEDLLKGNILLLVHGWHLENLAFVQRNNWAHVLESRPYELQQATSETVKKS